MSLLSSQNAASRTCKFPAPFSNYNLNKNNLLKLNKKDNACLVSLLNKHLKTNRKSISNAAMNGLSSLNFDDSASESEFFDVENTPELVEQEPEVPYEEVKRRTRRKTRQCDIEVSFPLCRRSQIWCRWILVFSKWV